MTTQFQKSIETVLKAHNQMEWFQTGQDFYLRLDQPNYDRLVIERHGETIIVCLDQPNYDSAPRKVLL